MGKITPYSTFPVSYTHLTGIKCIGGASSFQGNEPIELKVAMARWNVEHGCGEMENFMNYSYFKSGMYDEVVKDIRAVREVVPDMVYKVILETPMLSDDEIRTACDLCIDGGVDYEMCIRDRDKEGNKISLLDVISTDESSVDDQVELRMQSEKLYGILSKALTKRERVVIDLRYGLSGGEILPQREIARILGISRSYVSRIQKRALAKLHKEFEKKR